MNAVETPAEEKKIVSYKEVELPNGDIEMVPVYEDDWDVHLKAYKDNILCVEGDFGDKTTEAGITSINYWIDEGITPTLNQSI